ncbi:lipase ZK262.3-like isoform X4 [Xenia sp. Carnegie-2017]|uniref:lipase ZK262.3-like isoform X3 n=1 Tax=Xenia sp. Carnegie-2017 TaxID=2897299 RepID=UPI001F03A514|nr:lipase ZK262.3-like isoform X3 [Xenia sp. Carnegie-2017]XP_046841495.1 lipase ZK262.3-like isoform X4 [Xenia sp. Carnegie-2017]
MMALSLLKPCLLVFFVFALSDAWLVPQKCARKRNCVSCTKTKSWSGKSCRWCPTDKKCHAHGAVFTNPCSRTQNIDIPSGCASIVNVNYDKSLAYKMVYLCSLAYADSVSKYIPKATQVKSFHLVKQVTKPCEGNAKCSGFVAVSDTEQAIAVAFRGSEHFQQVITQALKIITTPKISFPAGGKVQKYFNDVYNLIWSQLKSDVYAQITKYPNYKVWVTGHSLGGAMASLASTALISEGHTSKSNLYMYTFGQPRVGNYDYALAHDKFVPISFRVTHYRDPVVHLPTCKKILGVCNAFTGGPYHHGRDLLWK